MTAAAVARYGLTPLARIVGYAQAEVEPKWLFLAPVAGVRRLLERTGLTIGDFDSKLFPIPEGLTEAIVAAYREGVTSYPAAEGIKELRVAVIDKK